MMIAAAILICALITVAALGYFLLCALHRESAYKEEMLKVQKDQIRLNGILIDSMGRCLSNLNERDK